MNSSSKLLDVISRNLKCDICQEYMFEPYVLHCGHTFCYTCSFEWFFKEKPKIPSCPTCRAKITQTPAPCFIIRSQVHALIPFLAEVENIKDLENQKSEAEAYIKHHSRDHNEVFPEIFKTTPSLGYMIDEEDNVRRCSVCNWELEDDYCSNCRAFRRRNLISHFLSLWNAQSISNFAALGNDASFSYSSVVSRLINNSSDEEALSPTIENEDEDNVSNSDNSEYERDSFIASDSEVEYNSVDSENEYHSVSNGNGYTSAGSGSEYHSGNSSTVSDFDYHNFIPDDDSLSNSSGSITETQINSHNITNNRRNRNRIVQFDSDEEVDAPNSTNIFNSSSNLTSSSLNNNTQQSANSRRQVNIPYSNSDLSSDSDSNNITNSPSRPLRLRQIQMMLQRQRIVHRRPVPTRDNNSIDNSTNSTNLASNRSPTQVTNHSSREESSDSTNLNSNMSDFPTGRSVLTRRPVPVRDFTVTEDSSGSTNLSSSVRSFPTRRSVLTRRPVPVRNFNSTEESSDTTNLPLNRRTVLTRRPVPTTYYNLREDSSDSTNLSSNNDSPYLNSENSSQEVSPQENNSTIDSDDNIDETHIINHTLINSHITTSSAQNSPINVESTQEDDSDGDNHNQSNNNNDESNSILNQSSDEDMDAFLTNQNNSSNERSRSSRNITPVNESFSESDDEIRSVRRNIKSRRLQAEILDDEEIDNDNNINDNNVLNISAEESDHAYRSKSREEETQENYNHDTSDENEFASITTDDENDNQTLSAESCSATPTNSILDSNIWNDEEPDTDQNIKYKKGSRSNRLFSFGASSSQSSSTSNKKKSKKRHLSSLKERMRFRANLGSSNKTLNIRRKKKKV